MRTTLAFLTFLAAAAPTAASARGESEAIRYVGIHPIAAEHGGGFCYIEFPHVHVYAPTRPDVLYRKHDDGYYFVGDPTPYGYEGPKQAFYGPHPIHVSYVLGDDGDDTEYCYLDGPHYHSYAPEPEARFKLKGGVYFYTGQLPRAYIEARPRYARINAVYRPFHYARPVVVESPPPEYSGPVYVEEEPAPTYVVPARASVGVRAEAGIGISAGIGFGAGVHIGGPPPPPPTIVEVHEVRPTRTIIVHDRPEVEVIHVREKHDNGWHRGHYKKGRWH